MPKNKKSRSRTPSKHHGRHKHSRSRSHSRDRPRRPTNEPPRQTEKQIRKRESKWSDKPPEKVEPQTNILFDSAITISNPGMTSAVFVQSANPLQNSQKELFSKFLEKKEEENGNKIEFTINPQMTTDFSIPLNHNSAILAQAGIPISQNEDFKSVNPNSILTILNPCYSNLNSTGLFKHTPGINPNIINTLNDPSKIKRKIYVPQNSNFNFTGLIIGPKGANQKRLEEETGCKILVRGKGSQKEGQVPQPDDNEPQHVLVVGDNEMQVAKAVMEIERILFADEDTRNKLRQEQLKIVAQLKNEPNLNLPVISLSEEPYKVDLSLTTPYGPPSQDAYIIPVPNDCVGLVIGKGGDTIKMLQVQSGARKVQVAADSGPNSTTRNVFVEGDRESISKVKKMLQEIIDTQQKLKNAISGGGGKSTKMEVPVPDNLVGLIIGRGGDTIKNINHKTGAFVFIPKSCEPGSNIRVLVVSGLPEQIEMAKNEIDEIVNMGQKNLALKAAQMFPQQPMMGFNNFGGMQNFSQQNMNFMDDGSKMNGQDNKGMDPMLSQDPNMNPMYNNYGLDMNNMMMGGMPPNMFPQMFDPSMMASYQQQMQENQLVITDVVEDERPAKKKRK